MVIHFPPIRSFVRREGRMTTAQRIALENLWPLYGVTLDALVQLQRENSLGKFFVEIGFGMGHSLLAMAEQFPTYQFLGIDIYRPGIGAVLQAIDANKLQNVRIVSEDAVDVLQRLNNRSVDGLLIFFPDPWPKRRHHKRRLIQSAFIHAVMQKLKVGGYLHIATDWKDYADHIAVVLNKFSDFKIFDEGDHKAQEVIPRALTKFELRGKKLGHAVYEFIRVLGDSSASP
jgi:tRNA (guanine-N7-)-methyltransferase